MGESRNYYSIVQFVPDPQRDERINVGVIVVAEDGSGGCVHFPDSWVRARQFARRDVGFLRDFARDLAIEIKPQLPLGDSGERWTKERLAKFSEEWRNSIQITRPRASLTPLEQLADDIYSRFVKEPPAKTRAFRDKRAASSLAVRSITRAVAKVNPKASASIKRHELLKGNLDEHRFDVVLQNGRPLFAARGLSFEVPHSRELERDVDAVAWAIDDIRRTDQLVRLSVVALPPKGRNAEYDRARRIYEGLHAEFVAEQEVEDWAVDVAKDVLADKAQKLFPKTRTRPRRSGLRP